MFTLKMRFWIALLATLSGCAAPAGRSGLAMAAGPNCVAAPQVCTLQMYRKTTMTGADVFLIDIDWALPPSNATMPVDVYWKLPPGYEFANSNDGPQLVGLVAAGFFKDNYVTDANLMPVTSGPGVGFHWRISAGSPYEVKYNIVFREAKQKPLTWVCDPTIASFGDQFLASASATRTRMICKSSP